MSHAWHMLWELVLQCLINLLVASIPLCEHHFLHRFLLLLVTHKHRTVTLHLHLLALFSKIHATSNANNDSCVYHDVQVYYLRASSEVERQRWVTALTLTKAKAVKDLESGILFNPTLYIVLPVR